MSAKKILLLCTTFPPTPGIGGRRWAKFSKYLSKQGYQIHVAAPGKLSAEISEWNEDIKNPNIIRHEIHFSFRKLFLSPKNIFSKILRKGLTKAFSFTRYSERFVTSLPNKKLWVQIQNLIQKENISTIIVSGDPFLSYYACLLKNTTRCKVILDYRDLWNDHSYYKTHYNLTKKQQTFFEEAENFALNSADLIFTVDNHLKDTISERIADKKNDKIVVVSNGFDEDDFLGINTVNKENKKIKLYFSGNIASDLNKIVLHFASCFAELKLQQPKIYEQFEITIKGKMDADLFATLTSLQLTNLKAENNFVSLHEYLSEVAQSDMGIIILSKEYANSYTTKFSDYLYLNKRILVLGHKGEFSDFLQDNNCGEVFTKYDNYTFFQELFKKDFSSPKYNQSLKESFNVKHLTEQIIPKIEGLTA